MNYSAVFLIPNKSIVLSREECDTTIFFANKKWRLPVVPSNMKSTVDFKLAKWMVLNNYFYILHRFYNYEDIFKWISENQNLYISISIGVKDKDLSLLQKLLEKNLRLDCVTIDIAHGFSISMEKMLLSIKKLYSGLKLPFIIAGNVVGDRDSIKFLEGLGVNCIKVGLAFGKACSTYNQTGFASPMFSTALESSSIATVPLIGDGGVRENGDIVKGLVAGYKMIMCGSIFASCRNSPSPLLENGNKLYYGSASELNKRENGQEIKYIEGKIVEMPCNNMTYEEKFQDIENSLKSAISYGGGVDLSCFNSVKWKSVLP